MAAFGSRYETDARLAGVLSHFYVISVPENASPGEQHLSPNLEMMVVFNFGPPVSFSFADAAIGGHAIDRIGILGPLRKMMNYALPPGADLLILPFILDGFYRFLPLSPDKLEETGVQAHTQRLEDIWQMLAALPEPGKRIAALTDYLLLHIPQSEAATQPMLDNVAALHDPLLNPVKVIADRYGLSERTVQLRFRKYVGYSPKELLRFLRFKQVLSSLPGQPKAKINWLELVVQYGYHDQSHLIKDFKYYTGISPQQFQQLHEAGNFCVGRD
ncbi:AraC family transcriptional regulator [Chitinophaga japonensis]|uniref:AraC-like DNA-binding protein n=1 Tax=Chitinophaga japonensis TaxID=104662 RepID=A0A562TGS4_CHIJA|nr:helix-turn-helix domain-containing protein [Chitinophaga japonensis]TWI92378.1 AraC-like DNA-binding protein [Chitinophaga japonensis]